MLLATYAVAASGPAAAALAAGTAGAPARLAAGIVLAGLVALLARRGRSLSTSGAAAATVVGALAVAAGWAWGALLLVFFAASTAVSRVGRETRERRTAAIVAKGGERDLMQVLANGGVFAVAALGSVLLPHPAWAPVALGALGAAISDTWATEVGTLAGGQPRSILSGRRVPHGTSGGVSLPGTVASVAGAVFLSGVALALGWPPGAALAGAAGGVAGATVDSLLGATLQARRWCDGCAVATERNVHGCGAPTRMAGGIAWLDNDAVNVVATCAGAVVALALRG